MRAMEIEKSKNGNNFSETSLLDTTLITHKAAIIAYESRIRVTFKYRILRALRIGRRSRIMDKGKTFFRSPSRVVFCSKGPDKFRLYSTRKTANVKAEIATVSGTVDKG